MLDKIKKSGLNYRFNTPEYYTNAADYLKTDDLEKIVKFVNSSNSKAGIAYWICRGLDENNHIDFKHKFINSSYIYTTRKKVASTRNKTNGNSYGYCGYTELMKNGKQYYCRSTAEYIYVNWFFEKEYVKNKDLKYEERIFIFDNFKYKPDFFIYQDNKLIKIIEIKTDDRFIKSSNYKIIKQYFKSIGIKYEVIFNMSNLMLDLPGIKNKIKNWKKNSTIKNNTAGKLNPKFINVDVDKLEEKFTQEFKGLTYPITTLEYKNFAIENEYPQNSSILFDKIKLIQDINTINGFGNLSKYDIRQFRLKNGIILNSNKKYNKTTMKIHRFSRSN